MDGLLYEVTGYIDKINEGPPIVHRLICDKNKYQFCYPDFFSWCVKDFMQRILKKDLLDAYYRDRGYGVPKIFITKIEMLGEVPIVT